MQIETCFLCEIGCSGRFFLCSYDSAVRVFKPTSTTAMSGAAPSALPSALDSRSKPAPTHSSLAAKRRAAALHVVFFSKHPSPTRCHTYCGCCCCCCCCCCVYSRMMRIIAAKDARWVRCSSWSIGPSPRRPIASCRLAAEGVRASWLYS